MRVYIYMYIQTHRKYHVLICVTLCDSRWTSFPHTMITRCHTMDCHSCTMCQFLIRSTVSACRMILRFPVDCFQEWSAILRTNFTIVDYGSFTFLHIPSHFTCHISHHKIHHLCLSPPVPGLTSTCFKLFAWAVLRLWKQCGNWTTALAVNHPCSLQIG